MQDFRKLHVWERAQALAGAVRATTRTFPRKGYSDLTTQMIRAAESVVFNIAEGCGATTPKDFAKFLTISSKSTMELESQLELARAYEIIAAEECINVTGEVSEIRRMLWGLRSKVLNTTPLKTGTHN